MDAGGLVGLLARGCGAICCTCGGQLISSCPEDATAVCMRSVCVAIPTTHPLPVLSAPPEQMYEPLADRSDAAVRKNTLMVLTHLILNDMMKARAWPS